MKKILIICCLFTTNVLANDLVISQNVPRVVAPVLKSDTKIKDEAAAIMIEGNKIITDETVTEQLEPVIIQTKDNDIKTQGEVNEK